MRDKGPCDAEYSRIADKRSIQKFRQLAVIAGGQVGADFTDLLFDQMIVVDQPFCRGCDGASLVDSSGAPSVGVEQRYGIVGQSSRERRASRRGRRYRLCDGEATCMLLETFHAEQLFANRLAIIPRQRGRRTPVDAANKPLQSDLSPAPWAQRDNSIDAELGEENRNGDTSEKTSWACIWERRQRIASRRRDERLARFTRC
jgi:hypothetical protein